jgi:hypothetical protein
MSQQMRMDLGNFRSARTDFRGHYRLEGVLSGEYWVVVTRNGGFPGSPWDNRRAEEGPKGLVRVQIDLPPGEPQQQEFHVYTGGVDCPVMIPEGKGRRPIRGGYAQFKPFDSQSGVETKWVRISRTGRIRTEFLPVGEWTFCIPCFEKLLNAKSKPKEAPSPVVTPVSLPVSPEPSTVAPQQYTHDMAKCHDYKTAIHGF